MPGRAALPLKKRPERKKKAGKGEGEAEKKGRKKRKSGRQGVGPAAGRHLLRVLSSQAEGSPASLAIPLLRASARDSSWRTTQPRAAFPTTFQVSYPQGFGWQRTLHLTSRKPPKSSVASGWLRSPAAKRCHRRLQGIRVTFPDPAGGGGQHLRATDVDSGAHHRIKSNSRRLGA